MRAAFTALAVVTLALATSVQEIAGQLGSSLSASDAKAGVVTALQQLQASYQKTFAPLNCD